MILGLDEASLIFFFLLSAGPLLCNVGREKTFQKTLLLKSIVKNLFLIQTKKETLLMPQ